MAVYKCKMCGGALEIQEGMTVCECEYCGSKQTVPVAGDEKKMKLFDRANKLLRNCEFDKAGSLYEGIIEEYPDEAEGYWGSLLCKYGIEYVDDPVDGRKVPTCHRSSFESFMDDPDFEMIMENADANARSVYREQAKQIEEIRKGIMEVSANEQPYDIFICYKETDENGERTLDSVLAQDVYDTLTAKGYRVFFSRISLEDKLGTEYEPYIFAALNSAKIMLAFGTSYDYYNAVWVKNEWSRFLKLLASDKTKYLIPCYKDIDAYDVPKEFAKFQAQDMGKVGAVQDLMRGIDKLMGHDLTSQKENTSPQTVIPQVSAGPNVTSLIDRGKMSLEDGAYEEAVNYYNRALDIDSKSAEAYLGLFMADIKTNNHDALKNAFISGDYTSNKNWSRAKQFASGTLLDMMHSCENERNARLHKEEEEAKRLQEETDYKKREYEAEMEELEKQLQNSDFEMTTEEQTESDRLQNIADKACEAATNAEQSFDNCPEKQDVSSLESEICSKKAYMNGLGIFKGREKKEIQAQIDDLENQLNNAKRIVEDRKRKVDDIKEEATLAQKKVLEHNTGLIAKKIALVKNRMAVLNLMMADVGGVISFGQYETGNSKYPIEWEVLDKRNGQIFIISKDALMFKPFHNKCGENESITWKDSDLRKWLNKEFIENTFTYEEAGMISETMCEAPTNPEWNWPCEITKDKVFLLSIAEVEKYASDISECITIEGRIKGRQDYPKWWLRSPGAWMNKTAYVTADGLIIKDGEDADYPYMYVRPALWIIVES